MRARTILGRELVVTAETEGAEGRAGRFDFCKQSWCRHKDVTHVTQSKFKQGCQEGCAHTTFCLCSFWARLRFGLSSAFQVLATLEVDETSAAAAAADFAALMRSSPSREAREVALRQLMSSSSSNSSFLRLLLAADRAGLASVGRSFRIRDQMG